MAKSLWRGAHRKINSMGNLPAIELSIFQANERVLRLICYVEFLAKFGHVSIGGLVSAPGQKGGEDHEEGKRT